MRLFRISSMTISIQLYLRWVVLPKQLMRKCENAYQVTLIAVYLACRSEMLHTFAIRAQHSKDPCFLVEHFARLCSILHLPESADRARWGRVVFVTTFFLRYSLNFTCTPTATAIATANVVCLLPLRVPRKTRARRVLGNNRTALFADYFSGLTIEQD